MAGGILDDNDYSSAMSSNKFSATVAELLTGKRAQVGSARTASASLSGVRSCGARLAVVKSSGARSGARSMRGCVGGGATTRANAEFVQVRPARNNQVVNLQGFCEGATSFSGVVAALGALIAELQAAAAADRVLMAGLRQENALQAHMLQTANASLQHANTALQN